MASKNRLTNNSDETDVASLLSGDLVFSIPYFQRPYKWKTERLKQLNADLLGLVDETSDFHFLGAMIVHGRRSNPSDPDHYDVIDGQQRITTIYLYLCAAVRHLSKIGAHADAAGLLLKYLVINRETKFSNLKLHPGKDDRAQLNHVFDELLIDEKLKQSLGGFKFKRLTTHSQASTNGILRNNFKNALAFFDQEYKQGGRERIDSIYINLLNKMSVVQIDVKDPTSGPKIFDSLNSRQEPMTVGDLVRNEIFARVEDQDPDEMEHVDQQFWQPFYKKFDIEGRNIFDKYFFPYGLISNANLKKSEVYGYLRKKWSAINDPCLIIGELSEYQNDFLDMQFGSNLKLHPLNVSLAFNRLWRLGAPSSTFPFLMQLSNKTRLGEVPDSVCEEVLGVVESFLVRRAVCGIEPTGLHAVFKRLWSACEGKISAAEVAREISQHKTIVWPTEVEFLSSIKSRPLYGASILKFLMLEYDRSLNGEAPSADFFVEHILPQTPSKEWDLLFTEDERRKYVDVLANLVPLSGSMNSSLGNKSYEEKKIRFSKDAMFKSTRAISEKYLTWTAIEVQDRAEAQAHWAKQRWPYEPPE